MANVVKHLASVSDIPHALPLTSLSVILFTALWSREDVGALSALESAAAAFHQTPASSHIAFYRVDMAISDVHRREPERDSAFKNIMDIAVGVDAEATREYRNSMIVYNATQDIPWFPALRIFVRPISETVDAQSFTHEGSFTAHSIREFITTSGQTLLARRYIHSEQSQPARLAGEVDGEAMQDRMNPFTTRRDNSETCAANQMLQNVDDADAASWLGSVASRVAIGPVELSTDQLTTAIFESGSNNSLGALLLTPGGAEKMNEFCREKWELLRSAAATPAADKTIQETRSGRGWISTVVDTLKYREVAQRYGVDAESRYPALVLLDANNDNIEVHVPVPGSVSEVSELLIEFESATPRSRVPPPRRSLQKSTSRESRSLSTASVGGEPNSGNAAYVSTDGANVLDVMTPAVQRGPVWVIVHQPWCGFSQRVAAVYREFALRAPEQVTLVDVSSGVDELPPRIDELVDGFPTVLRPAADYALNARFEEFYGPHHVEDLLRLVRSEIGVR